MATVTRKRASQDSRHKMVSFACLPACLLLRTQWAGTEKESLALIKLETFDLKAVESPFQISAQPVSMATGVPHETDGPSPPRRRHLG